MKPRRPTKTSSPCPPTGTTPDREPSQAKSIDAIFAPVRSIPAWGLSLLVLFAAAVKLFSVSKQNPATVAAIIRTTSTTTLLAGTFASLLPAFVAILIAVAVGWWAETVCPTKDDPLNFDNHAPVLALILLGVVAFYAMPLLAWIPFAFGGSALFGFLARKLRDPWRWSFVGAGIAGYAVLAFVVLFVRLPRATASTALSVIIYFIVAGNPAAVIIGWFVAKPRTIRGKCRFDFGYPHVQIVRNIALAVAGAVTVVVLLTGTMWLPIERVNLAKGIDLNSFSHVDTQTDGGVTSIAGYMLRVDTGGITVLSDSERAVLQLAAGDVTSHEVCVPAATSGKWLLLYERPSQIVTNPRLLQPYKYCP